MLSSPSPEGGGEPQLTCAHDPPGAFAGESEASAAPLAPPPPPPPPLSLPLPLGLGVAVSLCTLPKFVLGHSDERGSLLYRQTVARPQKRQTPRPPVSALSLSAISRLSFAGR